jgi:hypothetical protein
MHGDYTIIGELSQFYNEARTAQIFLVNGRHKYMVICYDADTDYNHAEYFMEQQIAEDFAEDWINDE